MRDDLRDLELQLEQLGDALAYPRTPDLSTRVLDRLAQPSARPVAPVSWRFAGLALAALLVAVTSVIAIAAPAREAVADLFDRINIFEAEEVPVELTTDIRGEIVTLEQARARFGTRILLPASADGSPQAPTTVIYQEYAPTGLKAVALFFEPAGAAPFVLFETNAEVGKGLGPGAEAEPVAGVGDGEAYWLEGLRIVQIYDEAGNDIRDSQRRTDANTLIWVQNGFVFRVEGDLSQEEAVQIARSLK